LLVDLAIFYADGSVVEVSNDDAVEVTFTFKVSRGYLEAPAHGVQAIIQRNPYTCREVLRGKDHYYALPGGMIHNANDLTPFFAQYLPGIIKHGVTVGREEWTEIARQLRAYQTIPRDGCRRERWPDDDLV